MKTNLAIMFLVALLCLIFTAGAFAAPQTVHPRRGEGPVQVAERCGVDPGVFIRLNMDRFVNPKRVSLIYTWQEFVLPEEVAVKLAQIPPVEKDSHKAEKGEEKLANMNSKVDFSAKEIFPVANNLSENFNVLTKVDDGKNREAVLFALALFVSVVVLYVLMVWLKKDHLKVGSWPVATDNSQEEISKCSQFFKKNEEADKFVCRCRDDGICICLDWNENFLKFPQGLDSLAKFLAEENISHPIYAVPPHLADNYIAFDKLEQRAIEDRKKAFLSSS